MTEQRSYLYGKLSVLEAKEIEVTNHIHAELFKNQFSMEASSVQSIDTNDIETDVTDWKNQAYFSRISSQAIKLKKLRCNRSYYIPKFKVDSVLNLSSRQLTNVEINVLARGFNFRPSLPDLPILDYVVATEAIFGTLNWMRSMPPCFNIRS